MLSDINNLTRINKTQIKPAADVLSRAFQNDPLFTYFLPNEVERENKLPHLFEFIIRYTIKYGEVFAPSPDLEGIALWLPSEKADMSPWGMLRSGVLSMPFKMGMGFMRTMMSYMEYATEIHKRWAPFEHWYLCLIGVAPTFQGKGYASAMLKPMFSRMDTERIPCYLETLSQKDVSIYRHYGFELVEEGTIPGTKTALWAMLRQSLGDRGRV